MASFALPEAGQDEKTIPPKLWAIWAVALAGCLAAGAALAFALTNPAIGSELGEPLVIAALADWITLSYVLCGLVAWWRRPTSRFGLLMIAAGFVNFLSSLYWTTWDVSHTVGQALDLLPPIVFLHVFLAFPSGRLRSSFERYLIGAGYAIAIGLELVRMAFGGLGPNNLLEIEANPDAALVALRVQLTAVSALCLCVVGVLVERRVRTGGPLRRSLAHLLDAFGLSLVMIVFLFLSLAWGGPGTQQIRWATFAVLGLAPLIFLLSLLHSRLVRSSVGELVVELRGEPEAADLRDALAKALRDPSLELVYWLPEFGTYADLEGRAAQLPERAEKRATTLIDRDGVHLAALIHDPVLKDEPELLEAVTAAAGLALENGRLHVELWARLEELRGSRARVIDVAQQERKRLERDLHDGAQQRLIALSLELGLLGEDLGGDSEAAVRLDQARRQIATSLDELRAVAHGIHPAVVTGHGLEVALEQLAARAPVLVQLNVQIDGRLPERFEVAAFYLVSESLANIGKHAHAASATIDLRLVDGQLVVEIVDDGVGGADTEQGSGLRGLADRVESLEGRLRVWSPVGGGTRLRAEIPCA